jgi:hypothetical protein
MREEEELIEEAQRSRAETAKLRDGEEPPRDDDVAESPLPEKHDPEPWAKTSSGDTDSIVDDGDD